MADAGAATRENTIFTSKCSRFFHKKKVILPHTVALKFFLLMKDVWKEQVQIFINLF